MHDVRRQFIVLDREGRIAKWYDRENPPGAEWRTEIDRRYCQELWISDRRDQAASFRSSSLLRSF